MNKGSLVSTLGVAVLTATAVMTAAAGDGKPPPSPARPAPPEASPYQVLVSGLQMRLRAEAPKTFAGTARASDGGIDVYATSADPVLSGVVDQLRAVTGGQVSVHIVAGMTNSLATLEEVHRQILARQKELLERGIKITEFGVDIRTNRVRIGVKGLTPDATASLAAQFGADRILVVEGGEWAPTSRTDDSPPWWGGIRLNKVGGFCTAGYSVVWSPSPTTSVTTAGHCGSTSWFNGPNADLVGDTGPLQYSPGGYGDMQALATPGGAQGYVYISETYALPVRGYVQVIEQAGDLVCANGYFGGERCGSYVEFADQCIVYINGWTICGMTIAYNPYISPATESGDSGGPVYHYYSDGVSVRGLIGANQTTDQHRWAYTPAWLIANSWGAYPRMA